MNCVHPLVPLGQLIHAHYGKALKQENRNADGDVDVFGSGGPVGKHDQSLFDYSSIVIGRKGSVGQVTFVPNGGWVIDTAYYVEIKDQETIDLRYLFHALQAADLAKDTITTSIPGLNRDALLSNCIAVPPLEEQKRIAAILDKADSLRRKRQQTIQLADDFLRAVFLDMFGDPVTNPKGWQKDELGALTTKIGSGATPLGGDSVYKLSGMAFIRSLNVHDRRFVMKNLAYIDTAQASRLSNVEVLSGDLLLNITGASVARSCLVPAGVLPARVNQHVCIIRSDGSLVPEFLEAQIICEPIKKLLLGIGESMGATRQAITKAQLEFFKVIVPPLSEQKRFAAIVAKVMQNKLKMQTLSEQSELLFQSLQQQAFV